MDPDDEDGFESFEIEDAVRDILNKRLRYVKYERQRCSKLNQDLCSAIRKKSKEILKDVKDPEGGDRYKLAVKVILGQDTDHTVHVNARCLWNPTSDRMAVVTYRNQTLYAVAMVYGIRSGVTATTQ